MSTGTNNRPRVPFLFDRDRNTIVIDTLTGTHHLAVEDVPGILWALLRAHFVAAVRSAEPPVNSSVFWGPLEPVDQAKLLDDAPMIAHPWNQESAESAGRWARRAAGRVSHRVALLQEHRNGTARYYVRSSGGRCVDNVELAREAADAELRKKGWVLL